jgi:hypothetical protein
MPGLVEKATARRATWWSVVTSRRAASARKQHHGSACLERFQDGPHAGMSNDDGGSVHCLSELVTMRACANPFARSWHVGTPSPICANTSVRPRAIGPCIDGLLRGGRTASWSRRSRKSQARPRSVPVRPGDARCGHCVSHTSAKSTRTHTRRRHLLAVRDRIDPDRPWRVTEYFASASVKKPGADPVVITTAGRSLTKHPVRVVLR